MHASNLIRKNGESHFIFVKDCGLLTFLAAEYVGTGYINDGSTMCLKKYPNHLELHPPTLRYSCFQIFGSNQFFGSIVLQQCKSLNVLS